MFKSVYIFTALFILSCSGCNDDPPAADTDTDSDTDTDTDSDTDTDTDSDSDSDTYHPIEWGDPIPRENDPMDGMACIPGGKYVMGCVQGDDECEPNEKPMVEFMLSPFFMDRMEARNVDIIPFLNTLHEGYVRMGGVIMTDEEESKKIWGTYYNGTPIQLNNDGDYQWGNTSKDFCQLREVESAAGGLSWYGAKLYCEWQGKQLPTEAQWEASARGQTVNEYPCGSDLPICWYGKYDCCNTSDPCFDTWCFECCIPFEEESNCESPYGIINQLGNAAEWVLDWRDYLNSDHTGFEDGCTDPEPTEGERPILKGGGVGNKYKFTRISARKIINGPDGNQYTGVRCVRPDVPLEDSDAGTDGGKK